MKEACEEISIASGKKKKKKKPCELQTRGVGMGIKQAWTLEQCLNLVLGDIIHWTGSMAESLAAVVT